MFPTSMQGLAGPIISQLPITPFNMVCTNVPGPQFPLYLLGRKMLHCYPYVPVGGEMAVNCAILSYNGMVYFGFSGDVHAAPDLKRMEDLLRRASPNYAKLLESSRLRRRNDNGRSERCGGLSRVNNVATATVTPSQRASPVEPSRVPAPAPRTT